MKPTIVCLCGSTRFIDAFQRAEFKETLAGRIVLTIGCDTKSDGELFSGPEGDAIKRRLDELHLRKIDLADEVLILNVACIVCGICGKPTRLFTELSGETECCRSKAWERRPYIGDSTRRELAYARLHGKTIRFLEEMPC